VLRSRIDIHARVRAAPHINLWKSGDHLRFRIGRLARSLPAERIPLRNLSVLAREAPRTRQSLTDAAESSCSEFRSNFPSRYRHRARTRNVGDLRVNAAPRSSPSYNTIALFWWKPSYGIHRRVSTLSAATIDCFRNSVGCTDTKPPTEYL